MSINEEFKRIEGILYNYPVLKIRNKNNMIELELLEEEDSINELKSKIAREKYELAKVDNMLEVLKQKEKKFIECKYFYKNKYVEISSEIDMCYDYINEFRVKLIKKIINLNIL